MTRKVRWLAAAVVVTLAATAGLYGTARLAGNRHAPGCAATAGRLAQVAGLARGEMAAFDIAVRAEPPPPLVFQGADGSRRSLDDFRGRTILLNLWATWCEPCKREMPALDALQASLGGPNFEVVAVNLDTRDLERPKAWLQANRIGSLGFYADPKAKVFQDLRSAGLTEGLPTTLLVGPDGCSLGRLAGWADWAGPDGRRLLAAALGRGGT